MINATIKKTVTDAIATEQRGERKWADAGAAVRAEYATLEAFEAVRAQFLDEVIYPAMGDDAIKVIRAEVPRKGSKDWNEATTEQRAAWSQLNDAKKTVRGKGSVYVGRVSKYAFPSDPADKGPTAPRDLKTRFNEEIAALIKAAQKAEQPSFDVGPVIGHLEAALKYVNK